jgi:hypothetical protein
MDNITNCTTTIKDLTKLSIEQIKSLTEEQIDHFIKIFGSTEVYYLIYIYR